MEYVYEISLASRIVQIDPTIWRKIRDYVNYNRWFFVMYEGKKYKYMLTRSFYDRPAIYMFELANDSDEEIELIWI